MGQLVRRREPAETLVEVLIAIAIVSMGSAAATTLITDAIRTNSFSRDNLIAMNLATEGLEAMRNIRDSNWLKFAYDKEGCWNIDPGKDVCAPGSTIAAGNYRLDLNLSSMKWLIKSDATTLNLNDAIDDSAYRLSYLDADSSDGTASHDLYVSAGLLSSLPSGMTASGDTPYYRMITVSYDTPVLPATTPDTMTVTSLVQWRGAGLVHEVRLVSSLTNYQKVKVN